MKTFMKTPAGVLFILNVLTQHSEAFFVNAQCGRALYSRSGTISSPSYTTPNVSRNVSETCEWRITAPTEEKIILNVTNLDIQKSPDCTLGYLEVRAGYWYDSPLLGRFCGQGRLDPVISTTNKMFISYVYHNPDGHRGFIADYQVICGADLFVDTEANFTTPNYPDLYPLNKKCVWRIFVHEENKVLLRFDDFDLESQSDCLYDYVEVRDGSRFATNLTGVYCKSGPLKIVSSHNTLLVKFVSDATVQKRGFFASIFNKMDKCADIKEPCAHICVNTLVSYRCECRDGFQLHPNGKDCEVACGGILNTTTGTIKSLLYPAVYPLNRNCTWDIVTTPLKRIVINFKHFDVEYGNNGTCDKDSLKIFRNDNSSNSLQLHDVYCGNAIPPTMTSEGNMVRIAFSSDSSVQRTGFELDFATALIDLCQFNNGNCDYGCLNASGTTRCVCNPYYILQPNGLDCVNSTINDHIIPVVGSSLSGSIVSPNYPNFYPNKVKWYWQLTTTPGHRFNITVHHVDTHSCDDYLLMYDNAVGVSVLQVICTGSSVPQVLSSANRLGMQFISDKSGSASGFRLTYATICGGNMQAPTTQPNYIYSHAGFGYSTYDASSDCEWTIRADAGYRIELSFPIFQLQSDTQCTHDYVEMFTVENSSTPSFGKYCGIDRPPRILSESNYAKVRFRSDATVSDVGFNLKYQAVIA